MSQFFLIDEQILYLINNHWRNDFFDMIMPFWRHKLFWAPLYVFFVSFVLLNFKMKGLYWIFAVLIVIGISDTVSSKMIKKTIKRERPCNDILVRDQVNLLVTCGSGFSFTSSHATNHFAIAIFIFLTLGRQLKHFKWLLLFWAFSIAYGQVYVGVHFPFDVICGALIGTLIGLLGASFYESFPSIQIQAEDIV